MGERRWPISEIAIGKVGGGQRDKDGQWRPTWVDPYLPKRITADYHPGGNSLCYMLQTAILMGCDPIYLLGFTLQSGAGYFFGRSNPVTKRTTIYDSDRALQWLRWLQERMPGRVFCDPDWAGSPVSEVFPVQRAPSPNRVTSLPPAEQPLPSEPGISDDAAVPNSPES